MTVVADAIWTRPKRYPLTEDDEIPFDVEYEGATDDGVSLASSLAFRIKTGQDETSTHFPTGAVQINGNIVTHKTLKNLDPEYDLLCVWKATVNGRIIHYKTIVPVSALSAS